MINYIRPEYTGFRNLKVIETNSYTVTEEDNNCILIIPNFENITINLNDYYSGFKVSFINRLLKVVTVSSTLTNIPNTISSSMFSFLVIDNQLINDQSIDLLNGILALNSTDGLEEGNTNLYFSSNSILSNSLLTPLLSNVNTLTTRYNTLRDNVIQINNFLLNHGHTELTLGNELAEITI